MSTSVQIDDDVIAAVRPLAEREGRTVAEVVSDIARQGVIAYGLHKEDATVLPHREAAQPVTAVFVNELIRDLL